MHNDLCRASLAGLGGHEHELGEQIVDTLALHSLAEPGASLSLDDLCGSLPMLSGEGSTGSSSQLVLQILGLIVNASGGVIVLDSGAARFDATAAGAPEVARFNAMIVLVRRFDPSLAPAKDASELAGKLARLKDAMTNAVESASRTRDALTAALREANLALPAEHERAIADYIGLAERGADAIIEAAADPRARAALTAVISAYESLAAAASAIPKMRAMREYLAETELRVPSGEDSSKDRRLVALETECQLLGVELGPRVLLGPARNLDALDARFHKFRWTYVQQYRTAHEEWRAEMDKLARLASDASRYLAALKRLNAISALGPPAGEELEKRVEKACARIRRCDLEGPLRTEMTPRCPACDYVLDAQSPAAELSELIDQLKRALDIKLAALSQTAIARIIRDNDRAHRLDGFLKITQASQTDALVRVLDEQLARYLARMLDENLSGLASSSRAVVRHLDRDRLKPRRP